MSMVIRSRHKVAPSRIYNDGGWPTVKSRRQAQRTPWPYSFGRPLTDRQRRKGARLEARRQRVMR